MENATQLDKQNDVCSICLTEIQKQKSITQFCCHQFHYECIKKWLLHQTNCPLCLQEVLYLKVVDSENELSNKEISIEQLYQGQESKQEAEKLDFQYFDLEFIRSQLDSVESKFDSTKKQAYQYIQEGDDDELKFYIIEKIELKIEEIDNIISKQLQFNPEKIVREIYDLDEQTQNLKNLNWKELFTIYKNQYQQYCISLLQNQKDNDGQLKEDEEEETYEYEIKKYNKNHQLQSEEVNQEFPILNKPHKQKLHLNKKNSQQK